MDASSVRLHWSLRIRTWWLKSLNIISGAGVVTTLVVLERNLRRYDHWFEFPHAGWLFVCAVAVMIGLRVDKLVARTRVAPGYVLKVALCLALSAAKACQWYPPRTAPRIDRAGILVNKRR
jgi:hypothetical protein